MPTTFDVTTLAELFRDVDAELAEADSVQDKLDQLCATAVDRVETAEWAGVSQGRGGSFATIAATAGIVRDVDSVQYGLASGPCVQAMGEGYVLNAPDLADEPRWPEFGRAAVDLGVRSMMSFRLFLEDQQDTIAALNFYAPTVGAFDEIDERLAVLLATHGALLLNRAVESARADHLAIALNHSREIGISIGILMATYRIPRDESFQLLRLVSQRTHRKLADIATEVADTGALPELAGPRGARRRPDRSATDDGSTG